MTTDPRDLRLIKEKLKEKGMLKEEENIEKEIENRDLLEIIESKLNKLEDGHIKQTLELQQIRGVIIKLSELIKEKKIG